MHTAVKGGNLTDIKTNIIFKGSDVTSKLIEMQLILEIEMISALMYV